MAKGDVRRRRLEELGPLSEENRALIRRWVDTLRMRCSENTCSAYRSDLEQLARSFAHNAGSGSDPLPGITPLERIQGPALQDWFIDMRDGDGEEPEWSAATYNRKLAAVRQFYAWLQTTSGASDANPSQGIRSARRTESIPKFLEAEDIRRMVDVLEERLDAARAAGGADTASDRFAEYTATLIDLLILGTCYYWGLRISEAVGIRMADLKVEDTGDFTTRVRRKGGVSRVFPSQPQLVAHLHDYLRARAEIAPRSRHQQDYLFLYPATRRPLTRQTAFMRLRSLAIEALGERGCKVSPHWLRHSLARHMIDENNDLITVQEALQHRRLETTAIYLKTRPGSVQEVLRSRDLGDAERARRRQLDAHSA